MGGGDLKMVEGIKKREEREGGKRGENEGKTSETGVGGGGRRRGGWKEGIWFGYRCGGKKHLFILFIYLIIHSFIIVIVFRETIWIIIIDYLEGHYYFFFVY